jgi:hypothetical protein
MEELGESLPDRKQFLHTLVAERLDYLSNKDLEEFDKRLEKLRQIALKDDADIWEINRAIKSLSRATNSLFKTELALFKILEKRSRS